MNQKGEEMFHQKYHKASKNGILTKINNGFHYIRNICDCLSENPPSSHLLVFLRNIILKIQLKITSLAFVVEIFTEHNNT